MGMDTQRQGQDEEVLNVVLGIHDRPPPPLELSRRAGGPKKKAVSLMDMAESDAASKGNVKSLILAEMYGM